ncbi:TPA: threonine synthase [Candidatus Woesearchaeota archaeon]|nr:threonine synthase [Candidatus Woesearchaeota archaeon]HII89103.1 threonine synthase [Candidatus Woesearchaeota archaeon]
MTYATSIQCMHCKKIFSSELTLFACASCGGPLDILYNYEQIKRQIVNSVFLREPITHWKYSMFYPINQLDKIVTLQEGGTPLVPSVAKEDAKGSLFFKYEACNPTGVFKDRGTSVEITKAVELGIKEVACATTGNMGASVAAYAGRAGIKARIFIPNFASPIKIQQIKSYGATIIRAGKTYDDAHAKVRALRQQKHIYLAGDYAHRAEGQKSVGFEIVDQLNWQPPSAIVMPVGNGVLFSAVYKAMCELKIVGLIKKLPRLIAVQAKGCNPIVQAYRNKKKIITPQPKAKTLATAILCGNPLEGERVLEAIRATKGTAVSVSDQEMLLAQKQLGKQGLFAELSSTASYAGVHKLGLHHQNKGPVVCVLTGHGLKDISIKKL